MTLLSNTSRPRMGIIGFGAFGRLMAQHLAPHFDIIAYDPALGSLPGDVEAGDLATVAAADIVVLAVPVAAMRDTVLGILPHLQKGALLLDVGSVKIQVETVLRDLVPPTVDVIATHPLFGPQSARNGLRGLKIALCPLQGARHFQVAAFLRALGLQVIVTTPERHDQELAMVQGLTHLIAKVLSRMGPMPRRMSTRSFDLICQAVDMVRDDAPEVFEAIELANPYAGDVRERFFAEAQALARELADFNPKLEPVRQGRDRDYAL